MRSGLALLPSVTLAAITSLPGCSLVTDAYHQDRSYWLDGAQLCDVALRRGYPGVSFPTSGNGIDFGGAGSQTLPGTEAGGAREADWSPGERHSGRPLHVGRNEVLVFSVAEQSKTYSCRVQPRRGTVTSITTN